MGLQGYVGSGEDVRRIRRQEQQLEEERTNREAEKQQRDANVSAAGFRQFGKGAVEVSKRLSGPDQPRKQYLNASVPFRL